MGNNKAHDFFFWNQSTTVLANLHLLCTAVFHIFSSPHPPKGTKESNNMEVPLYKERRKTAQYLKCT